LHGLCDAVVRLPPLLGAVPGGAVLPCVLGAGSCVQVDDDAQLVFPIYIYMGLQIRNISSKTLRVGLSSLLAPYHRTWSNEQR
jgi:hypothetical protein